MLVLKRYWDRICVHINPAPKAPEEEKGPNFLPIIRYGVPIIPYKMIEDAKICWLETALEDGIEIPEPSQLNAEYSGRLNIRIPKSLHRTLVEKAKAEKISLNQYINYQLSKGTGHAFK